MKKLGMLIVIIVLCSACIDMEKYKFKPPIVDSIKIDTLIINDSIIYDTIIFYNY